METIEIHEGEKGISFFSLNIDGKEIGRMTVSVKADTLKAGYTSIGLTHRKGGYGKKLVNSVVEYARENNLKIIPECGFVAMMFNKHPDLYDDIRAPME
ncbi:GNAT family N-acetyltransferase [Arachidicoccus terrestris]|uniref:GNAT family N-acetyltransferase n=1 Tax=Arachidicoccus terrestris TaxID=2875539 RepID=UPI001CC471D8|nr:GNAT family N-acetyltransferase [Arachidicoccus terrestris]UAY56014.1 GNAT family N-acetyltransferase [Arachidicoccus terrestris]